MISDPARKYRAFPPIDLRDRQWPERRLDKAPIWMSTDLRDGNQALIDPMSVATKLRFFKELLAIGFKQIEVGFPSASDTDYNFVRALIEENHIPDDVYIEVLTQARADLIEKTVESLRGAKRAILHVYNPLAPSFRRIVYKSDKAGVKRIAVDATRLCKTLCEQNPQTEWIYQYSPETFSSTELEFSKEVCDAVTEVWQPTPDHKIIFNLPATVECATPNVYADQIEWMHRKLNKRDCITLSVHPHNDRGTAVAAAELALMAGADRVEGCLFGNGERTGNVDLITLALNLYSQGVDPQLNIDNIDAIKRFVEQCNNIPVHPRHPYAGELVYTAFSGSHQDAIKKGFAVQDPEGIWEVPYLPIDPADVGRDYDAVVRVNSQSGKGGVSFLLQRTRQLELPRRMQIEFSRIVQGISDSEGRELSADRIAGIFDREYFECVAPIGYRAYRLADDAESNPPTRVEMKIQRDEEGALIAGRGNGAVEAATDALSKFMHKDLQIIDYHEHSLAQGAGGEAICYIEARLGQNKSCFGVGRDVDIVAAAFKALINAVNRSLAGEKVKSAAA